MTVTTPIEQYARINPVYQKKLKRLGIKTIQDLLYHFPHRYEDFSDIKPISKTKPNETVCIQGKILEIKTFRTLKRKMFLTHALVEDKTGAIKVVWFNQPYLTKSLKKRNNICLAGKIVREKSSTYLSNPAYEIIRFGETRSHQLTHTGRIVPIYPETMGLSSRWLRYIIKPLLANFKNKIPEILPLKILKENELLPISAAIGQIHFPGSLSLCKKAQERFSFEELFLIELFVLRERTLLDKEKAAAIPMDIDLVKKFVKSLPFKLTNAQRKSTWQILKDMEQSRPMNRLLEGDVGSGKTVIALIAALETIKAGYQVAFMAPTEILVKQHFQEIASYFKDFKINIGLLTGKENKFVSRKLKKEVIEISRAKLLEKTRKEEINILIGTHALIQDKVKFGNLGLVILDEQHRFGVEQRARLCQNSGIKTKFTPHLLSMTATPIPRTLALTVYGDLDLSLIDELPKGRKKIITKIIRPADRKKTYSFIKREVKKGRQIFVLCPRIEPNDKQEMTDDKNLALGENLDYSAIKNLALGENLDYSAIKNLALGENLDYSAIKNNALSWTDAKAVKEEYEKLSKEIFPDLKVEMLHGKMCSKKKEKIMKGFKNKKIDILVSTSVIEVGIDIPNATVMLIEGAERFGLAQLHQFRGRVGRSNNQSYCFLFTESPTKTTFQRLRALISSEDGFKIAEKDLAIRGPGDFSGFRQWGIPDLTMNSLKDIGLVEKTRATANELLKQDPKLKKYPLLKERLNRFQQKIHLE